MKLIKFIYFFAYTKRVFFFVITNGLRKEEKQIPHILLIIQSSLLTKYSKK